MRRIASYAAVIAALVTAVACGPRQEPAPAGTTPQTPAAAPGTPAQPAGAPSTTPAPAGSAAQAPATTPGAPAPAPEPSAAPGAPAPPAAPAAEPEPPKPEYEDVTIPAGTALTIVLESEVGSATSKVEDPVRGHLGRGVTIKGLQALPKGAKVAGVVTDAKPSAKVKGLASVAFRFTNVRGTEENYRIHTSAVTRQAQPTKGKDAKRIGIGTGAGALIGGIAGGGKGAAIGAGVGAATGTGVVLATKGKEVTVPAGTTVTASLSEPLTVRVLVKK